MAFFSQKFKAAMEAANLTHQQQEAVVAALAREPNLIAAVENERMDRADRLVGRA